jgi:hypothetical protein
MEQEPTQPSHQLPLRKVNHTMQWTPNHHHLIPHFFHLKHTKATKSNLRHTTNHTTTPQPTIPTFTSITDNIPFISSTDNISPSSSTNHLPSTKQYQPQVKTKANPQPLPLPQFQGHQQQTDAFPTHGTILKITGGSNTDFGSKRQRRDYYREVNHVVVKCPITQTKWSHTLITFSTQDVNLTSFPHTDAMVFTIHIDQWDVSKILVDNGSQAVILFLSTLEKVGYKKKQLKEPMKPPLWLWWKKNQARRSNNITHLIWHPKKFMNRIRNLRCCRYAISLQCHFWPGLIEHL